MNTSPSSPANLTRRREAGAGRYTMDAATAATCSGVTDMMHTLANEPSIGLYYVAEHIQRSLPALVADKATLIVAAERLRGADLDAGYALDDMRAATSGGTSAALANIAALATRSVATQKGLLLRTRPE